MTMFPAHRQNLRKKDSFGGYGGSCGRYFEGDYDDDNCFISLGGGGSDLMAEDESRTEISNNNNEEAQGSSSRDIIHQEINKDDDGGWLQLSLGSGHVPSTTHYQHQIPLGPRLVELDLLPGGSGSSSGGAGESSSSQQLMMRPLTLTAPPQPLSFQVPDFRGSFFTTAAPLTTTTSSSLFLQPQYRANIDSVPAAMTFTHQYDYLPFRPAYPLSMTTVVNPPPPPPPPLSSSPSLSGSLEQQLPGSGSYHGRPLHFQSGISLDATAARMDIRVVDPPPRPHSGVWFMLKASQNQTKEPYLPQVPKSYLRIRDGRTSTVGLLIKYLVNKLKLDSEFEIEITCKGQQLLPFMTLHHVRDNIWHNPRSDAALFSPTSVNIDDHLMVLKYGRIA